MKNICKIHPLTYLTALIFICLGYFKFYLSFMLILIIHELGHITFALIFKWHIKKLICLPMGLLLQFEDNLNKPLKEEFVISIMGIVFQIVFVSIIHNEIFNFCSSMILIFNILPIYPLDGSKIVNIILNKITNFKTSYFLTLIFSYIFIMILSCLSFIKQYLLLLISLIPLLVNLFDLIVNRNQVFIKFLLERYLYDFKFKKIKYIKNASQMKRDYYHLFVDSGVVEEKNYLRNLFKN